MPVDVELDASAQVDDGQDTDLGIDDAATAPADDGIFDDDASDDAQIPDGAAGADGKDDSGTTAQEPEAPAAPAAPATDPALEAAVEAMGLDAETVKVLRESNRLEGVLRAFDAKVMAEGMAKIKPEPQAEQSQQQQQQTAPQTPQAPAQPTTSALEFKTKAVDGDDFDPNLQENLKALQGYTDRLREEVKGAFGQLLKEYVTPLQQQVQGLLGQLTAERLDRQFDSLGEEWAAKFGKGSIYELDPNSEQAQNRKKLAESAFALITGLNARGQKAMLDSRTFRRALYATFGDELKTIARQEASKQAEDRRKQMIGRPTHRKPSAGSKGPMAGVYKAVADKMRALNMDPGELPSDDDLGI